MIVLYLCTYTLAYGNLLEVETFSTNSLSYFINCYVLKGIVESMDVFIYIFILRKVSLCLPCWPQTLYVALNSFCIIG